MIEEPFWDHPAKTACPGSVLLNTAARVRSLMKSNEFKDIILEKLEANQREMQDHYEKESTMLKTQLENSKSISVESMGSSSRNRDQDIRDMDEQIRKLGKGIEEMKAESKLKDRECMNLEEKLAAKTEEVGKMSTELEKHAALVNKLSEKNSLLEEDTQRLRGENVTLRNEVKQLKQDGLNDELKKLKDNFISLRVKTSHDIAELLAEKN